MWTIIFIIGVVLFVISLFLITIALDGEDILRAIGIILLVFSTSAITGSSLYTSKLEFNSKKYTLTTEIKQTVVNDSLIKSDTIYVIIYKK